jgi:hypothetical protein
LLVEVEACCVQQDRESGTTGCLLVYAFRVLPPHNTSYFELRKLVSECLITYYAPFCRSVLDLLSLFLFPVRISCTIFKD